MQSSLALLLPGLSWKVPNWVTESWTGARARLWLRLSWQLSPLPHPSGEALNCNSSPHLGSVLRSACSQKPREKYRVTSLGSPFLEPQT